MAVITPPPSIARTDTYVREDKAGQNFGSAQPLGVSGVNNKRWYTLLGFTQPFDNGVYVTSAFIRLTRATANSVPFPIEVRRITGKWQNLQVTWSNRPNVSDTNMVAFTVPAGPADTYFDIDVTALMADVAAGGNYYGLEIRTTLTTANTNLALHSRDNGNPLRSPTMLVSYSPAPEIPTQLVPNGLAFPAYPARFSWLVPAGSQAFYQVQVSNTTNFTAPTVDTGWVPSDIPAHTFASGAEGYWRVRIRNAAGAESGWSQPAQTYLAAVPTVTIVHPVGGAEANDSPVWVQFTVATTAPATKPAGYEAWLYDEATGNELGHLTRVLSPSLVSGTPIDIVIPGHIPVLGGDYRVEVLALDDIDRSWGTGANPYGWAEVSFTVVPTLSANSQSNPSVNNIFAIPRQDPPFTTISWRGRDTLFKEYQVFFDDTLIKVVPSTGAPGGPQGYVAHEYIDYGPRGNGTWSVHGVQETTAGGILADRLIIGLEAPPVLAVKVVGIYLFATQSGESVKLLGQDPGTWDYSEDSSTFFPAGGPPTMVTTNQRGYEGSIGGVIVDEFGDESFRAVKAAAARGEEIRLVMASFNFPILLGKVALAPSPVPTEPKVWTCEFEFVQNGEFDSTWPT